MNLRDSNKEGGVNKMIDGVGKIEVVKGEILMERIWALKN